MSGVTKEYCQTYTLTAGESNPQGLMPVTLFAARVIEVATFHANELGVGFDRLVTDGLAWVLSRLSIEMYRSPKVNGTYTLRTWIEGFNRHFSERNFEMTDGDGEVIGHARSIWMAINIKERSAADLSMLESLRDSVSQRVCPIEKVTRFAPVAQDEGARESVYRFRYCDCDFNRHVNTLRYMELLLNQWDMDFFDAHRVSRFDIAFMREAKFGDEAVVRIVADGDNRYAAEICGDGGCYSRGRISFVDYQYNKK